MDTEQGHNNNKEVVLMCTKNKYDIQHFLTYAKPGFLPKKNSEEMLFENKTNQVDKLDYILITGVNHSSKV